MAAGPFAPHGHNSGVVSPRRNAKSEVSNTPLCASCAMCCSARVCARDERGLRWQVMVRARASPVHHLEANDKAVRA
jgi:hypothetical protein